MNHLSSDGFGKDLGLIRLDDKNVLFISRNKAKGQVEGFQLWNRETEATTDLEMRAL